MTNPTDDANTMMTAAAVHPKEIRAPMSNDHCPNVPELMRNAAAMYARGIDSSVQKIRLAPLRMSSRLLIPPS
jgi:hypothetical protein